MGSTRSAKGQWGHLFIGSLPPTTEAPYLDQSDLRQPSLRSQLSVSLDTLGATDGVLSGKELRAPRETPISYLEVLDEAASHMYDKKQKLYHDFTAS